MMKSVSDLKSFPSIPLKFDTSTLPLSDVLGEKVKRFPLEFFEVKRDIGLQMLDGFVGL